MGFAPPLQLSRPYKRGIRSRLQVLLAHLLKRQYINSPEDFRGWEITIRDQRSSLTQILENSPSLKLYLLDNLDSVWQKALSEVREDYPGVEFPQECPFPADAKILLSEKFGDHKFLLRLWPFLGLKKLG